MQEKQDGGSQFLMLDLKNLGDKLGEHLRRGGILSHVLDIDERECEALYALGYGMYEQAHYAAAMKVFAQLVAYNHMEPRYLLALGAAAQVLGHYREALQQYIAVAAIQLDDPGPLYHSAECLIALGRFIQAREALDLAMLLCANEKYVALGLQVQALRSAIQSKLQ
jgi:type III secretion system low calcium response chaperone LcrH/SycD